jgi:hypothetical protein
MSLASYIRGGYLSLSRGFALEEADGTITYLGELWTDDQVRMNEGGVHVRVVGLHLASLRASRAGRVC